LIDRLRNVAIYTAYSDEAGIGDPAGEFLVCGYLGAESVWRDVETAWRERVLEGPPAIPQLHMTDIRSWRWRERYRILYYDSDNRVAEAVRVIHSTGGLDAVASVIKRSVLHEVFPKQPASKKKSAIGLDIPDYLCYLVYILLVLNRTRKLHPDATRVNFVFAEKEQTKNGMKLISEATRLFLGTEDPEVAELCGDFRSGNPESEIPLQVADLICWHLQCNYRGGFPRTDENRMWCLLKERDGDLHEWSKEGLEEFAAPLRLQS
jgi:hypothetical protein